MGGGSSKGRRKPAKDLQDYDDEDDYDRYGSGRSPSHSYYQNRGGRRVQGGGGGGGHHWRGGKSPNMSPVTIRSSRSAGSLSRMPSRAGTANSLGRRRRNWAEETAKRIHVVVRVRPLNVREIKEGQKVGAVDKPGIVPTRLLQVFQLRGCGVVVLIQ